MQLHKTTTQAEEDIPSVKTSSTFLDSFKLLSGTFFGLSLLTELSLLSSRFLLSLF